MRKVAEGAFAMEHHSECLELRRQIELDGLPSDPEDVRYQFVQMVANAEGLRLLFNGQVDAGAVENAHALARVIRAADAAAMGANAVAPPTRH